VKQAGESVAPTDTPVGKPAQPERLDREEVTLDDRGRLLAPELPPADARSSRRRLDAVAVENVPNAARRQLDPERDQLALDAPNVRFAGIFVT
jgi:hypothetical protein